MRERAIAALISCRTVKLAAKQLGISYATLRRWLKDPDFARDYQRAREQVLEVAAERLRAGTLSAVEVLMEIAQNRRAAEAPRVTACRSFLEATGLLHGANLTINNNLGIPSDPAEATAALVQELVRLMTKCPSFRQTLREEIEVLEREAASEERRHDALPN